ncbi:MAG: hypothetical protein ACR2H1_01750, partial [Limisphaerales bacterium]
MYQIFTSPIAMNQFQPFKLISYLLLALLGALLPDWANGALVRQSNTSLQMPSNPQDPYVVTEAMGGLTFNKPVNFAIEPGATNRLFIVERTGIISVITNLANPTRTVFMDITNRVYSDYDFGFSEGLSSVAFHPGYATNRYFYVTYTIRTNLPVAGWRNYNRIARFQRSATDMNQG